MLSDEHLSPEQAVILGRMTPEERWRVASRLYWTMRRHKTAFLRSNRPELSDQEIDQEVRRLFLYAGT